MVADILLRDWVWVRQKKPSVGRKAFSLCCGIPQVRDLARLEVIRGFELQPGLACLRPALTASHSLSRQPPASASANGLLSPWRRCRPAAPQRGHHCPVPHAKARRPEPRTGEVARLPLAENERDERCVCLEPAVCIYKVGVAALNHFVCREREV